WPHVSPGPCSGVRGGRTLLQRLAVGPQRHLPGHKPNRRAPRTAHLARQHYEQDDERVLPRSVGFKAFENAMTLDIAMGGSTNTILHLLAIAREAEIDFTMADIDRLSRSVPQLCKVAPNTQKYHIEDVHRAGGIFATPAH